MLDQLGFLVRRHLVVHAAQSAALAVEGDVALDHGGVEAVLGELPSAVGAGEEAARVLEPLGLDDHGALERSRMEDHRLQLQIDRLGGSDTSRETIPLPR